ncbi:MAG: S-layer homology domain-containing protein, partial [Clostridia bacterium]|nr:S-layer homology domain-containing protein [Clostridia bacterium]
MKKTVMAILTVILVLFTTIITSVSANAFADVKESDWFYNDVEYVRDNKLMSGTSDSEFSPSGVTTRGMIVTVLWRLEGEPKETGKSFEDVNEGAYYYDAVAWASNNNIV